MPDKNDILIYNTPNGNSNVEVYLFDEDIWMTQAALADLFQTSRNNITMHVQNIYKEGELMEEATSKPDLLVRNEGSRTVKRTIKLEVYQFICPKAKEANKCALKNTHSSKERNGSGPLAFPWCLLIILVG